MTKAFDLALFVGTPVNVNDAPLIASLGPPFATKFASVALTSKAGGVNVGADIPAAAAPNQIMVSGSGPGFAWGLQTNPAAAAQVPPPGSMNDMVVADATPAWASVPASQFLTQAGVVLNSTGASFAIGARVTFAPTVSLSTRLDGVDPALSRLDNFTWDAGTF